jgi:excinuclease ABC subunit A
MLEEQFSREVLLLNNQPWEGEPADPACKHDLDLQLAELTPAQGVQEIRLLVQQAAGLGVQAIKVSLPGEDILLSRAPVCATCGYWFGELRPVHFNAACPHCQGKGCSQCQHTGLPPEAAAVRWAGMSFPHLLSLSVDEFSAVFQHADQLHSAARLQDEITRRLHALQRVGLG